MTIEQLPHELPREKPFHELMRLAIPTVAQMASYTVMQFIDTWLLSRLGTAEPTAAANAGMFAFSLISFGVGTLFVVNTLVSQSFGRGDFKACGQYLWQGIWFGIVFAALMLPLLFLLPSMFRAFGHEPNLVRLEDIYLRIVLCCLIGKLLSTALGQFLLATDRPSMVMIATVIGVSINAVAAWAFIFGHLGFHPMGIAGAAWGQNVGTIVDALCCLIFALLPAGRRKFNALDWRIRLAPMRELIVIGLPSGLQLIADVMAWSMFGTWVFAPFGTVAMAANTFMFRYMVLSFMPAFGFATAVTALVGRYIGMGRPDIARQRANLGFVVTAIYMVGCGFIFFLLRYRLIGVFSDDPEVKRIGAMLLTYAAFYQLFDAVYIVYNGALRGAGDTFVPAIATGVLCWGMVVFAGHWIAVTHTAWGAAGPWTIATVYGATLSIFIYRRFIRHNWRPIAEIPSLVDVIDQSLIRV